MNEDEDQIIKKIEKEEISILRSKRDHCINQINQMDYDLIRLRIELVAYRGLLEKLEGAE